MVIEYKDDIQVKISCLFQLAVHVVKSNEEITNKEITFLVFLFRKKFGKAVFDSLGGNVNVYLHNPGDIGDLCDKLKEISDKNEIDEFLLELITLVFIDGLDEVEWELISKIISITSEKKQFFNNIRNFFEGKVFRFEEDENILTFGEDKTDIQIPGFKGLGAFLKVGTKLKSVIIKSEDILINGSNRIQWELADIGTLERVSLGGYVYEKEFIESIFINKQEKKAIQLPEKENILHKNIGGNIKNIQALNLCAEYNKKDKKDGIEKVKVYNINFELISGEMMAIMGPSGSGKSTILDCILGYHKPKTLSISINGHQLKNNLLEVKEQIGYVPQDDILIENLTVKENLYYKYKLKFPKSSSKETEEAIQNVLTDVNLIAKMNDKVGSPSQKSLSGGERKRLNIAIELIEDPDVIFLDEPTSGLSSKDADHIMKILRSIADRNKIVALVIHQPSSQIYQMFDKILVIGKEIVHQVQKGEQIFFGNPLSVLDLEDLRCPTCENIDTAKVMETLYHERGEDFWKVVQWLKQHITLENDEKDKPSKIETLEFPKPVKLSLGERLKQTSFQFIRQFVNKSRDKMNQVVTFLIPFLLGILSSFMLKYTPNDPYTFKENTQYDKFIFLIVIVGVFLGLSSSVAEVIKDRLILKREKLMDLSILGYHFSKVLVFLIFALVQSILFIVPSHIILQEPYMWGYHIGFMTLIIFTGISIGLLISTFLRSYIAAYNLVPLVLVPQIILGGALISYEKLNRDMMWYENDPIPPLAQVMPSRWAYEMVATAILRKV